MLNQSLSQKLSQKSLPKIILQQNILSIPSLALENIIKRELELNPMLEEGNEFEQEEVGLTDELSDTELNAEQQIIDEDDVNYESEIIKDTEEEYNWEEYFDNEEFIKNIPVQSDDKNYEAVLSSEDNKSIKESLTLQLHLSGLSDKQIFTGEEIIWSLNDVGYFTEKDSDILADLDFKKIETEFSNEDFTQEDLDSTINFIQNKLDPPGIGARNLKECLILQIKRSSEDADIKKHSLQIIENHFDDLRLKRYEKISKELGVDLHKVKLIFDFIHKLNPNPGRDEEISEKDYIIPDLILKKNDDDFEIILNDRNSPSLRISKSYRDLYRNKTNNLNKETKEFIVNNFNKAKWFIDAINSRKETLLKIMSAILERQKLYFENNENGLKPMYEKEIAEDINMDASTISRAVRGKYVQTAFGIYELRSFFTTPLMTNEGEEVSNKEVKNILKEIIGTEDKSKPLSDDELSIELKKRGFKIARRTVAKYREAINIPVSKLRREIL